MNGTRAASCSSRASARSAAKGEMSETMATVPESAISRATWATRRMFSRRSPGEKPRSPESP